MGVMVAKQLLLESPGWVSPPVLLAVSPIARWRGLAPYPLGRALLIWGRSLHGRSMKTPLVVVRIDRAGTVAESHILAPGRVLSFRRAAWNLEMSPTVEVPPPGAVLTVRPMLGP